MEDDIKKIIAESVNAPSGDNSQPWVFRVREDTVALLGRSQGTNGYLDYQARGTHLAQGALIENISIIASKYKYAIMVKLFPEEEKDVVAHMVFVPNTSRPLDTLADALPLRTTNRKKYADVRLPSDVRDTLLLAYTGGVIAITCIEDDIGKQTLFTAATQMERIALENEHLHRLFFESIVWNRAEEQTRGGGLYLKTMELPLPVQLLFRFLKRWKVARFLSQFDFSSKVAKTNAAQYQSSSAALLFSVSDTKPETFIELGRAVERVWLTATTLGLAIQPLAGLIYVHQRLAEEKIPDRVLSDEQAAIVERSYRAMKALTPLEGTIGMVLRAGYAPAPSAQSYKRPPEFI